MARPSFRSDSFVDKPRLLGTLGVCRQALVAEMTRRKAGGPLYYSASTVLAAIDGLALMLTGQRTYFWEKGICPAPRRVYGSAEG